MNSVSGHIVSIKDGLAEVDVQSIEICARCAAGRGCGAGLFGSGASQSTIEVPLSAECQYEVGDNVIIGVESSKLLHASLLAYGLPLSGALLFVVLGLFAWRPLEDMRAAALAVTGLTLGWLLSRAQLRKPQCAQNFRPALTDRAPPDHTHDI